MSLRSFLPVWILLYMCTFHVPTGSASASDSDTASVAVAKDAVRRWLCWDKYWGWGPYELGRVVPAKIKFDGKAFYVRIDDIVVTDQVRMAAFYMGRIKEGHAAVILREAYDMNDRPPKKKKRQFENVGPVVSGPGLREQRKAIFENGSTIFADLSIPTDCTPHYDAPTTEKELMISTIVKTMRSRLAGLFTENGSVNATRVKIIIANFNVDYPSTYVLVEPTNEVKTVTLHDAQDYDGHAFEKAGAYPAGVVEEPSQELISKIKRDGIVKEIDIKSGR